MLGLPRESLFLSGPSSLCLVDVAHPKPQAPVVSLKPSSSTPPPPQCLSIVPPDAYTGSQGLAAWVDGPKRNVVYAAPLQTPTGPSSNNSTSSSSATATRWHPPQAVSCLSLSPDGRLLLCGCDDGRAYLWEVASGILRATWEPHFRALTAMTWTADGSFVATGSEDGRVCVWSLVGLYHPSTPHPQPYATLSAHLLPITALCFSPATCNAAPSRAQLWSASKDGTVKLWDLRSRTLLADVNPVGSGGSGSSPAVDALAVDQTGRFAFVAAGGQVQRIDVYQRISESSSSSGVAFGSIDQEASTSSSATAAISLPSSSGRPTSLCVLPSSATLAVGTAQPATILLVDVASRQVLRTVPLSTEGSATAAAAAGAVAGVTNLVGMYRANEEVGEDEEGGKRRQAAAAPRVIAQKLDRVVRSAGNGRAGDVDGEDEEDDEEYWAVLPDRWAQHQASAGVGTSTSAPSASASSSAPAQQNGAATAAASTTDEETAARLKASEARAAQLEAQVRRAAKLNDDLWQMLVKRGHVKDDGNVDDVGMEAVADADAKGGEQAGDDEEEGDAGEGEDEGKASRSRTRGGGASANGTAAGTKGAKSKRKRR